MYITLDDENRNDSVKEEVEPTGDGARPERQERRTLRELDAAVAERVMGWRNVSDAYLFGKDDSWGGDNPLTPDKGIQDMPHYSTDIAAAMEVVEKLREQAWSFACTLYEGRLPYASFCKKTVASSKNAEANTLPEAICRAALALVDGPHNQETK